MPNGILKKMLDLQNRLSASSTEAAFFVPSWVLAWADSSHSEWPQSPHWTKEKKQQWPTLDRLPRGELGLGSISKNPAAMYTDDTPRVVHLQGIMYTDDTPRVVHLQGIMYTDDTPRVVHLQGKIYIRNNVV